MQNENSGGLFTVVKGVLLALCASLLFSIVFACVLRSFPVPQKAVYPVNQTVKVLSVLLGALVFVRGEKGWLKGAAIGLLFTALSYLTFSAIGGDFSLSWMIFVELFLGVFAGVVGGAIGVNLRH